MSLNEICFFNNIDTIKTSEVISVENSEYLQLDVTGTASNFKIIVYAQVVKEGEFSPLAVIGNGNFKIYDSIESNGFYRVSTRGVLNVKLALVQIESGSLSCFSSLSLRRDISDWSETDETKLGYIKNKPFYTEKVEFDYFEVFIEKENIGKIWFLDEKIGLIEGVTYDVDLVDINGSILHSIALTATTEYGGVMVWNSEPAFSITDGIVDEELTPGDKTMINVVNQPDVRYVRIHGIPSTQVVYHKIPQEYLTKPDYNQNDLTQPDYIKNRPFYTETEEIDLGEIEFDNLSAGYMQLNRKIGLIEGWSYTIDIIDAHGEEIDSYTGVAVKDSAGCVWIGNERTRIYIYDGQDVDWNVTDNTCVIEFPTNTTLKGIRIKGSITVHHKIAQEYLDLSEAERLHYYGDSNIIPSDASLFTFTLDDATMTSSIVLTDEAKNDTSVTDIVIPYKYTTGDKEFVVKTIGMNAFKECSSLSSIVIPNSVTSIALAAFRGCASLSSITIPEGVTRIMPYTFNECTSLSNIVLPDSITGILNVAFYGCSSLSSISIPKNVISIGSGAFSGCEILENIIIPSGVKTISSNAFQNCVCLSKITIPPSVISISSNTFNGISDLIIVCAAGSYAEKFAKENGFSIEYTEEVTKTYVDGKIGDDLNERLTTVDESINTINETLVNKVDRLVDTTYEGMFLKAVNGVATWSPVYIAEEVNF